MNPCKELVLPLTAHRKATVTAGVPRSKEIAPPWDPAVALCLGPYGDPREVSVSCERGTPV